MLLVDSGPQGPLWDSYYAIGLTWFLCESYKKFVTINYRLAAINKLSRLSGHAILADVKDDVEKKLMELEAETVPSRVVSILEVIIIWQYILLIKKIFRAL